MVLADENDANEAAPTAASGAMPVMPRPFVSPPISPTTAVPWFTDRLLLVPAVGSAS
jgi:hypothetical protein